MPESKTRGRNGVEMAPDRKMQNKQRVNPRGEPEQIISDADR